MDRVNVFILVDFETVHSSIDRKYYSNLGTKEQTQKH
jgi:hypothetical protein